MYTHRSALLSFATSGVLAAGLLLAAPAADAATHVDSRATASPGHAAPAAVSPARLSAIRARQQEMLAQPDPAHTLHRAAENAGATVQRLTVTTTEDSGLADPAGTRCLDEATGACSLRAAVETANNRQTPVRIVLGKATYTLTTAAQLAVTNPAGTSIVGAGSDRTVVEGAGSRVLLLTSPDFDIASARLYLTGLTVTGGTDDFGGGIFVDANEQGGALVLDRVRVSGNTADDYGGGIALEQLGHFYARDSAITGNVARNGGGLYTNWSDVHLTDVDVTDNHLSDVCSTCEGGGWLNVYGVVRMKGGSISGNAAIGTDPDYSGEGGGLFDQLGNVSLTGVHVDHNTVGGILSPGGRGAGVAATEDILEITDGTISHNHALDQSAAGGGILLYKSQSDLHGVTMAGDTVDPTATTAGTGGGAIFVDGAQEGTQLTIDRGSKIHGATGSALYVSSLEGGHTDIEIDDSHLWDNSDAATNGQDDAGCGGAVCALEGGDGNSLNLTMTQDTVATNTSIGDGGSGAVTVWISGVAGARVHLIHSVFRLNTTGAGGLGGAVGVHSAEHNGAVASVRSQSNAFVANQAGSPSETGNGGAIGIEGDAPFFDRSSTFTQNRARGPESWGGAVYTRTQRSSRFTGTTLTKNTASPTGIGHGGAVFTGDVFGTTFTGVSVTRNRSGQDGGGIDTALGLDESEGDGVTVLGSTISGNVAGNGTTSGTGGGIHVNGVLAVENSTVTGNTVVQSDSPDDVAAGGGIYIFGGTLGLRYTTVSDNVGPQGGGVYSSTPGGAFLGSIVSANHKPSGSEQDCTYQPGVGHPAHSLGGNVVGQAGCVTTTQGTDRVTRHPRLGPLADNGGQTKTMALAKSSPAIGRATFSCPATDQRGRNRPTTHCDAGAFELPKVKKHHH